MTVKQPIKKKYCDFCDQSGIVHETHFEELAQPPLAPCPRCVAPKCTCGGEPPYYVSRDGKIVDCECRETRLKIDAINALYNESTIEKKYRWKLLADYRATTAPTKEVLRVAKEIVLGFPGVGKGLFLWGPPGTGKTLIASIILTELIRRHAVHGKMMKISRGFFQKIKSTFIEGSATYGQSSAIEQELASLDVLIVDDFGVQRGTEWETETLYNLVDARYEAEKFTIFTSNNNPAETLKDPRVMSRLKEMCRIVELSGEDYREKL